MQCFFIIAAEKINKMLKYKLKKKLWIFGLVRSNRIMRRALICFRVGTEFWTMNLFVFFTLFFNKNIITTSCKDSDYSLLELKEYYARLINHDVCLISFFSQNSSGYSLENYACYYYWKYIPTKEKWIMDLCMRTYDQMPICFDSVVDN